MRRVDYYPRHTGACADDDHNAAGDESFDPVACRGADDETDEDPKDGADDRDGRNNELSLHFSQLLLEARLRINRGD